MTALEAARALVDALGITYGEVVVQVSSGEVKLIRGGQTYLPAHLESLTVPGADASTPPHA